MKRNRRAGTGGLLLALVLSGSAGATTAPRLDVPDLTQEADLILIATARNTRSIWIDGDLVTLVRLDVGEVLKGVTSGAISLILPGGIDIDRPVPIVTTWPGQPRIDVGEQVLLFLREVPDTQAAGEGYYFIVGFSQGKFTIEETSAPAPLATQNLAGLRLADSSGVHAGGVRRTSLAQLRREIHQALTGGARGADR